MYRTQAESSDMTLCDATRVGRNLECQHSGDDTILDDVTRVGHKLKTTTNNNNKNNNNDNNNNDNNRNRSFWRSTTVCQLSFCRKVADHTTNSTKI